jgi:hypothetical protein
VQVLLVITFTLLLVSCQPLPPAATRFDADAPRDLLAAVPGLTTADLTNPRPVLPPELRAAMNLTRGRPPVLPGDYPDLRRDWF